MILSQITIYPVKGMRGTKCETASVEPRGLAQDRRYLVVERDGMFITQRDDPIMATIVPEVISDGLRLTRAGHSPLTVKPQAGPRRMVTIWKNEVEALDCGEEAAGWLSDILGRPCRLVHMDDQSTRIIDQAFAKPGEQVSFADAFPLLLVNDASLRDLNNRLEDPLPVDRFRGNVVIESDEPWGEDHWTTVQIGSVTFRNVKPCARCLVTTTDQQTGERRGDEPLRTLATFRKVDSKVMFGVNLIPNELGTISVGDPVTAFRA